METYKALVRRVLEKGKLRKNRTGIDTISTFGESFRHDMRKGMPFLTTKKIHIKSCIHELLWFLKGDTNIKYLNDNGVHIWDPWADSEGNLGPIYGYQWTNSGPNHVNQILNAVDAIKYDSYSRRIIIDAWNPSDLQDMALPPCHILYQFYPDPETKELSLSVYMRSADLFLGVPFDIAEGGLLLSMVAKVTGYIPYELIYIFGDTHIYVNHLEQISEQLKRECFELPKLVLNKLDSIFDYTYNDFNIFGYKCHPALKGKVAV